MTDITYVELKPKGTSVKPGSPVGEVESVKTTSDVYTTVGGTIAEINKAVSDDPSLLNSDPYGKGWIVKIDPKGNLADTLLSHEEYQKILEEDGH